MASADTAYDAAIVGAGVMGATTALFLARGGMRCVLVDRGGICGEASGVNAGTLTMHMTRTALIPYALGGWRMWTGARQWLGGDPGVTAAPGLSLAFSDQDAAILAARAAARRDQGAPIEVLDPARARAIEPGLAEDLKLAAHCPIDGHVTANRTGLVYRQALLAAGVALREGMPVMGIDAGDRSFRLQAQGPALVARRLVLAGGVWLQEMLAWLGLDLAIAALVNQLAVTERMPPVMRTVLGVANGLLSLKQFANGTVLIGGGWQGKGDRVGHTTEIIPANLIGNLRLARYVLPALADARVVRTWLGFEAETADAMPIIGPVPGIAGAFVIGSVHSGFTSGPYMGKLLSQLILGNEPERPLFDMRRLLATPPR